MQHFNVSPMLCDIGILLYKHLLYRMVSSAPSLPPAPAPATGQYQGHPSVNFTAKREAERAAAQDSHILHLRHQIETRLKVSLGEDLAAALADGVVLCHIANHVSPRAVSSIHVPSPAVVSILTIIVTSCKLSFQIFNLLNGFQPKLTGAKCRRNVDNFLSACRKIGVREVCTNSYIECTKAMIIIFAWVASQIFLVFFPNIFCVHCTVHRFAAAL